MQPAGFLKALNVVVVPAILNTRMDIESESSAFRYRAKALDPSVRWDDDQRLISAHNVLLIPNSLMKPSASSTPQSADCA
jgi:hypothetical protein